MKFSEEIYKNSLSIWKKFVPHSFLKAVADGTIDKRLFSQWLSQDFLFVKGAIRFMLVLASRAPDMQLPYLVEASYLISKEIDMFEKAAIKLGTRLEGYTNLLNESYISYLISIAHSASYLEGLTALYCEERAYYESWNWVKENTDLQRNPYSELISYWSSEGFKNYVGALERMLNEEAEIVGGDEKNRAKEVCRRVSEFELAFWDSIMLSNMRE
ncbi:MAG: TenA family protein [Caldisphaera sp.]|jgi:thiaminase|nr:hypothetical protein [Caldisphaera sp.]